MDRYVLGLEEIDQTHVALAGGKGANLGELTRITDVHVPPGYCVTTAAFERVIAGTPALTDQLAQLARVDPDDREAIGAHSAELRRILEVATVPDDVAAAITWPLAQLGEATACAVRSSATAEDLPTASFAGQHDSYLNVVGPAAVLAHVRRCWASVFTERATTYRLRNGLDHRTVGMAVVVQRMVTPRASGTLFTAHPATSNRRVSSIEATFGLGEALVAGRVTGDVHEVRDGEVVATSIATKEVAVHPAQGGGTEERAVDPRRQDQPSLMAAQAVRLAQLGRQIETHFGEPQDIEWCLVDDAFHIVQSRPITTLFPIPEADDDENHVYLSVGHQQMMTDPMKPLGISFWQMTAMPPMHEAGGRLFVDVTHHLATPTGRARLLDLAGGSDPLIRDALETVLERSNFIATVPDEEPGGPPAAGAAAPIETDPAIVTDLIEGNRASVASLERGIREKSGDALLTFILDDIQELRRLLFDPHSHRVFMTAMEATRWLNEHLEAWLGERNVADTLTRSAPHNITSQMGLALLDVADAIRPHPEVVAFLHEVEDDDFLGELAALEGGQDARDAILSFLQEHGMRCVGEIDITRPRWSEHPSALLPTLLANIESIEPGAARRRFERGRQEAAAKEHEVLERLRALPDGDAKADQAKAMIDRVRTFIGYREYPKYGMVSRYFLYKQALVAEAEQLAEAGVLRHPEDAFFLTFDELHDVVRSHEADHELIRRRRDAFRRYGDLTPPRVLTSDGEVIAGAYRRDDVPAGALVGLAVSAGTVEGRARVVLDMAGADLETDDILVTRYTDPSWTPVFVTIKGLVTDVGGLMTHGAVIAREYGLPTVVGVPDATRLIRDGQRIRLHGTDGYVEVLT